MSLEIILATVTAISTVGGAAGAYHLFRSQTSEAKAKAEAESLRYRYGQAVKEIEACHVEEELFCQELESIGAGAANSVKVDFRNRVETLGFARPSWKPSRIKDELRWLEEAPHRSPIERTSPHVKPASPLQYVVARHLDKFLSGDESARIRPLPAPRIEEPVAPTIGVASDGGSAPAKFRVVRQPAASGPDMA